jgi:NtrC-family two-component system response regulator AlgB
MEEIREEHMKIIMAQTPKLTEASAILGIDQATLYRKRKKMGWGVKAKTLPAKSYTETMPQM